MATFLPGLTDTVPNLPLYQPDFGFFNQMMQRKAAMYEQGFSQVKSAYDSILNAPLNAQGNSELRDSYLQQAQKKLKNLAGVDLSLHQNVEAANAVFSPFWQDQELLMDYAKSKKINDEMQKAFALQNSTDPKQREQFWQTGVDYVNLSLRELRMSKRGDGSIGKVQVNNYVPYFDTQGFLDARAKEQGLTIKKSTTGNGYIIERTNGDGTAPLYEEWAARQLANSPQAMDTFRVQGVVDFKNKAFNIMEQTGADYNSAKAMLADVFMKEQKSNYTKTYNDINGKMAELKAEIDGKLEDFNKRGGNITPQELAEFDAKRKEYETLGNSRNYYSTQKERYSNPESEEYLKQRDEIINNGESFFAENRRDAFIKNFGRIRALNSSVKLELDPVAKMTADLSQDMAKLRQDWAKHVDDMRIKEQELQLKELTDKSKSSRSGSGSSGGSGSDGEDLNAPLAMGLAVKGLDKIGTYQRMLGNKKRFQDQFINSGLSVIMAAGAADPGSIKVYTDYLNTVLRTGKYVPSEDLKNAHKVLQEAGIIPDNYKLGQLPTDVYNRLYSVSEKKMTAQGLDPSTLSLMIDRQDAAIKYGKLKDIEEEATKLISQDKSLSQLYDASGKQLGKNAFLKNRFGTSNFDDYLAKRSLVEIDGQTVDIRSYAESGVFIDQIRRDWDKAEREYDRLLDKSKQRLGDIMAPYINEEGAFISPVISLRTDGTGPEERAQTIATQIMNDNNLRNQKVTRDGILPINIDQLTSVGAKEKEVAYVLQNIKSNPGGVIDQVLLTPIGSNGKASVKLMLNRKKIEDLLGKDGKKEVSNETLTALADGMEFDVTTSLSSIPEFETEFIGSGIDRLVLNKQGTVTAPQFIKDMGMDYSVTVDNYSNRYIINMKYPEIVNGVQVTKNEPMYIPIASSLAEVQRSLTTRLAQIHNYNRELLQKNSRKTTNPPYGVPETPQVNIWEQYKQSNNIR